MFKLFIITVLVVAFIAENEAQRPGFMNEHDLTLRNFMMQQNPSLYSDVFGARPEGAGDKGKGGGEGKGKGEGRGKGKGEGKGKGQGKGKGKGKDMETEEE